MTKKRLKANRKKIIKRSLVFLGLFLVFLMFSLIMYQINFSGEKVKTNIVAERTKRLTCKWVTHKKYKCLWCKAITASADNDGEEGSDNTGTPPPSHETNSNEHNNNLDVTIDDQGKGIVTTFDSILGENIVVAVIDNPESSHNLTPKDLQHMDMVIGQHAINDSIMGQISSQISHTIDSIAQAVVDLTHAIANAVTGTPTTNIDSIQSDFEAINTEIDGGNSGSGGGNASGSGDGGGTTGGDTSGSDR